MITQEKINESSYLIGHLCRIEVSLIIKHQGLNLQSSVVKYHLRSSTEEKHLVHRHIKLQKFFILFLKSLVSYRY